MREVLSTESVSEGDRLDYWNQVASIVFWPLRIAMPPGSRYVASVTHEVTGALELSTVSGYQHEVRHTGSHAASSAGDVVALGLEVSGVAHVAQDGRACTLEAGDAVLFDPARPYSMRLAESFSLAVFSVPAALVRSLCGASQQVTARPLRPLTDVSRAALSYLTCVAQLSRQAGVSDPALGAGSLAIIKALLRDAGGHEPALQAPNEIYEQALAFIDVHLQDPGLAPADVASACHVSLRQLYRAFEAEGRTVAGEIRDRRLTRARALLETMDAGTPVAWIGSRAGFASPERFTRAFREAHGVPPGAWRLRRQDPEPRPAQARLA